MVNTPPADDAGFRPDDSAADWLMEWFGSYAQQFKSHDDDVHRNIVLKEEHTHRVITEILDIGRELALPDADMRIAWMIALLHDVGRFEQYARYRTFVDRHSENHAELGVKILRSEGVLDSLDLRLSELILRAIAYHNRPHLPQDEEEKCLFFSKLLRDADKLDIWNILIDYYQDNRKTRNNAMGLGLPESEDISADVYEDLMNRRVVDSTNVRNLNDLKLLQLGWVYEINFQPTHRRILERDY
ncbi:MAG: HD domain-containing protein, partial [Ignavibacteria bacterium]|nr:HD domain-containing protein [Ignavibacteria bacterium]